MLIDSSGKFLTSGHQAAVNAKKERTSKAKDNFGAKGTRQGNPKQVSQNLGTVHLRSTTFLKRSLWVPSFIYLVVYLFINLMQ